MWRVLLLSLLPFSLFAQQDSLPTAPPDTLPPVEVNAYFAPRPLATATNTIGVVGSSTLRLQPVVSSLVAPINLIPGVRMEERSPGSYRLSIRGSLLRSPFGVRNVKVYLMNELSLTDASGNTYLNLLAPSAITAIEVLKGPDASVFGANSGGVALLYPNRTRWDTTLNVHLATGSFGLAMGDVHYRKTWKKYSLQIDQAYQRSDGYRRNSQMQRHMLQAIQQWQYRPKGQLKFYHLMGKLQYETPGGLTEAQMEQDPTAARAPTPTVPGATRQKAAIYNTTTYHGAVHEWVFKEGLRHVASVFGSYTDFRNPFITNYETRREHTLGARTYVEWKGRPGKEHFSWINGYEYLYTFTAFENYGNTAGRRDTLQTADNLKAQQQFLFSRFSRRFGRLLAETSLSLNLFDYRYQNRYPVSTDSYERIAFRPQWMPRVGLSFMVVENLYLRASVSRGYSPPTLAEVRPSTNVISPNLQAEQGWNYEGGLHYSRRNWRWHSGADFVTLNVAVYHFRLRDAIVRREDANGAEYFTNAGGTRQTGAEFSGQIELLQPDRHAWVKRLTLTSAYTFQHFKFRDYRFDAEDFSGNWLTGVPRHIFNTSLAVDIKGRLHAWVIYNYVSAIPLNDANEVHAQAYHLLQARIGYRVPIKKREVEFYLSGDNLLNQRYSLGNDINAFGGRYYNPAPTINFLGGITLRI